MNIKILVFLSFFSLVATSGWAQQTQATKSIPSLSIVPYSLGRAPEVEPIDTHYPEYRPTKTCRPSADGTFTDTRKSLSLSKGDYAKGKKNPVYFGEAGGCLMRSLKEIIQLEAMLKFIVFKAADSYQVTELPKDPSEKSKSFSVYYFKRLPLGLGTLEWTVEWSYHLLAGTNEEPTAVLINYELKNGNKYMEFWKGSILLERVSSGVTSFLGRDHMAGERNDSDGTVGTVVDFHEKLTTRAKPVKAIRRD